MSARALQMSSALAAIVVACSPAHAADISISCGAVGIEFELCREAADIWAEQTGNTVTVVSTPNSATERLALYQQLLSAGAADIDVFQVDVIWPGILGDHFIDLAPHSDGVEADHFEAIIVNNTVDGELKAMPWYTDAGVLYYRADLLEKHGLDVPETWQDLTETARTVMDAERAEGADGMWGFVYQGRAYEGLTCNALEWIDSFGADPIVTADGEIAVDDPRAIAAIELAASWVDDIAPQGVLNYAEEEARGVFQSGNAVFMRNWPYAWALAQSEDSPIRGAVGVAPLPRGAGEDGRHTGTLGGWNLAVSKYSEHPEAAADLVMFLTSHENQKDRAIRAAYNPTIAALYEDDEVLEAVPFFGDLYDTFVNAVARPSRVTGPSYNRVSAAFWEAVHAAKSGRLPADEAMTALDGELAGIRRRGW